MSELVKVELGCGLNKTPGYIGVDRFALPGVDIVSDLEQQLPFDDDSVDIVYAQHSLEHLRNLQEVLGEIHRICKHKSIVMVLAPYHMASLNLANYYHKSVFNEDTFRFSSIFPSARIDPLEFECPNITDWGQGVSDNSNFHANMEPISIEFFYYTGYRQLSASAKRLARRSLINVCDQIFYALVINKTNHPFSETELYEFSQQLPQLEPTAIAQLRERDKEPTHSDSIFTELKKDIGTDVSVSLQQLDIKLQQTALDIKADYSDSISQSFDRLQRTIAVIKADCSGLITTLDEKLQIALVEIEADYSESIVQMDERLKIAIAEIETSYSDSIVMLNEKLQNTTNELDQLKILAERNRIETTSLSTVTLELLKQSEKKSKLRYCFSLFRSNRDMFYVLQPSYATYTDALIMRCPDFNKSSVLQLSPVIPFENYIEYRILGNGSYLHFFLFAVSGAKLFIEVVFRGIIIKQNSFILEQEGPFSIEIPPVLGEIDIRFRALDNSSIARTLETVSRRKLFFAKRGLAGYLE